MNCSIFFTKLSASLPTTVFGDFNRMDSLLIRSHNLIIQLPTNTGPAFEIWANIHEGRIGDSFMIDGEFDLQRMIDKALIYNNQFPLKVILYISYKGSQYRIFGPALDAVLKLIRDCEKDSTIMVRPFPEPVEP